MHVDLSGRWKSQHCQSKSSKTIDFKLQIFTIIDHVTGYPELVPIQNKTSELIANELGMVWFCRYPRCKEVTHDNGGEFIGDPFQELLHSCGVKSTPITVENPQVNAIVE